MKGTGPKARRSFAPMKAPNDRTRTDAPADKKPTATRSADARTAARLGALVLATLTLVSLGAAAVAAALGGFAA